MQPAEIKYHKASASLQLIYQNGDDYSLTAEYLRVYSPSAEVRGHSPDQAVLQVEKEDVKILRIEPQGNYAIRLTFDDQHDSGIYTWEYLWELAINHSRYWKNYLKQLEDTGGRRRSNIIATNAPVWAPKPD